MRSHGPAGGPWRSQRNTGEQGGETNQQGNHDMAITYEILALRYGILDGGRLQYQNYIIPDDHLAPDPLDFLVFAIRGNGRTIVMDTGFNPVSAKRRGRELLRSPANALMEAGI